MNLKALMEQRNAKVAEMETILNTAVESKRALSEDENSRYEQLKTELGALDATIEKAEEVEESKRSLETNRKAAADESGSKVTPEESAWLASIRSQAVPYSTREDVNTSKSNSGVGIPATSAMRIIKRVKELSPIFSLAHTYRINGTLTIPYEDGTTSIEADYVDDFTDVPATAQSLGNITLTGFVIGALAKVSMSLLDNSDIDLLGYVEEKIAEAIASKIDKEYLIGSEGKIQGIGRTVTNTYTTSSSSTAVTSDELMSLQDLVPTVHQANAVFIMHPTTRAAIRKLKDGQGNYLLERDFTAKWGYRLLGKDVYCSDYMPTMASGAMAIYYGDMSGLASKITSAIKTTVLHEAFARQHAVGVIAFTEIDAKIEDASKIAALVMKA